MIAFAAALVMTLASQSPGGSSDGIAVAKRLTTAINGKAEFRDSDFAIPPAPGDIAALRQFAPCRVLNVNYALKQVATEPETYVRNRDKVLVTFGCKGVPSATPAALSIELSNGKIGTIQTHNADLMKVR